MRLTKRRLVAISFGILVLLSLIPVPYLASPDWEVRVVDEAGNPVQGALVRLDYQNYSVEATGHEEDRTSDPQGYARFAAHRSSASTLARVFFTSCSAAALAHGSFGPNATVSAFAGELEGEAESNGHVMFWDGRPEHIGSTIVVRPLNP